MKTLTITEARKNLGFWLKAAACGEEISIISGADIIGLRKLRITAVDAEPQAFPREAGQPHPAIGMWKDRRMDGVAYQRKLRKEWERR
jgi:hypothetical protein